MIIRIEGAELTRLAQQLGPIEAHTLRIRVRADGVEYKINGREWSPTVGAIDPSADEIRSRHCAACGGPLHGPTWGCVRPTTDDGRV